MSLIATATVKARFPMWANYLTEIAEEIDGTSAEDLLANCITEAEAEFQSFVNVTDEDDMDDGLDNHLLNIIKYRVFLMKHGDTEFDKDPAIAIDYERTRKAIESGLVGTNNIRMTSKERIFDSGFRTTYDDDESVTVPDLD